jgi:putative DNA primase/helicase
MMQFVHFASAHGVIIDSLDDSGKIRRCPTHLKPKSRNGAYSFDGCGGWVRCWDSDGETHYFNDPDAKPLTREQQAALNAKREAKAAELRRLQARAAKQAVSMLASAKQDHHDYLVRKGFPGAKGAVNDAGDLLIPMRSVTTGELVGLQRIFWNPEELKFEKKMLFGTKAEGAYLRLGPAVAPETVLCEGYATGLSIQAAQSVSGIRRAVVICFTAGNLPIVAKAIPGKRIVFADNDVSGTGERVARETGLPWCMSTTVGEDANDIHLRAGLFAVSRCMAKAKV